MEAGSGGEFQRRTDAPPPSPPNPLVAVCGTGAVNGNPGDGGDRIVQRRTSRQSNYGEELPQPMTGKSPWYLV
jgi:hypothetical protein